MDISSLILSALGGAGTPGGLGALAGPMLLDPTTGGVLQGDTNAQSLAAVPTLASMQGGGPGIGTILAGLGQLMPPQQRQGAAPPPNYAGQSVPDYMAGPRAQQTATSAGRLHTLANLMGAQQ